MPDLNLPSFAELRRRYTEPDTEDEEPPSVSVSAALRTGDPWRVLDYLRGLNVHVTSLADLEAGVNTLADDEELAAFRCQEGVALSAASDGRWLLFTD